MEKKEREKMKKELDERFNVMLDVCMQQSPKLAKYTRKNYLSLIKEGFTKEQAFQIILTTNNSFKYSGDVE